MTYEIERRKYERPTLDGSIVTREFAIKQYGPESYCVVNCPGGIIAGYETLSAARRGLSAKMAKGGNWKRVA